MNISLPDALKAWAEQRVAEGLYSSASDYVRELMRRDQDETEKLARLQAEVDKGRASDTDPRTPKQIFGDVRTRFNGSDG